MNDLLDKYSSECIKSLSQSEVTKNLKEIRKITGDIPWYVVSGGDQNELRKFLNIKKFMNILKVEFLEAQIKKIDILTREIKKRNINYPALMFGDSKVDYIAASLHKIDFIFVYKWSDLRDYKNYCEEHSIKTLNIYMISLKII